jgi:hypothetical protein
MLPLATGNVFLCYGFHCSDAFRVRAIFNSVPLQALTPTILDAIVNETEVLILLSFLD